MKIDSSKIAVCQIDSSKIKSGQIDSSQIAVCPKCKLFCHRDELEKHDCDKARKDAIRTLRR